MKTDSAHIDELRKVDNAVLDDLLEFFLGNTEGWLHFIERVHEIIAIHTEVFDIV